jgi:alkylhydroperoxidase family enzyme
MDIRHAVGVKEGISDEKLTGVLAYRESPHFNERERAALEFGERTIRDDLDVSDECMVRLREHFDQAEIVELAFIIGYQTFASKFAKSFSLAPQGFSSRSSVGFRV